MSETIESNSSPQPEAEWMGESDIQRAALRELVKLSSEAAAEEAEIDREHRTHVQQADRRLQKTRDEITQKFETAKQAIETEFQNRLSGLTQEFDQSVVDLQSLDSSAKQQLDYDNENAAAQIKSQYQQAVWLAESVFEATQNQIAKEIKKAKEDHVARGAEVDELSSQSLVLLALYGQRELASTVRPEPIDANSPIEPYDAVRDRIKKLIAALEALQVPRLFVGIRPILLVALICILPAVITQAITGGLPVTGSAFQPRWIPVAYAFGGSVLFCIGAGLFLRMLGKKHVLNAYRPLRQAIEESRRSSDALLNEARAKRDKAIAHSTRKRDLEVQGAKDKTAPLQARAQKNYQAAAGTHRNDFTRRMSKIQEKRDQTHSGSQGWLESSLAENESSRDAALEEAQKNRDQSVAESESRFQSGKARLKGRWDKGLASIQAPFEAKSSTTPQTLIDWNDPRWAQWSPPKKFPSRIRFGELLVDLKVITDRYPRELQLPERFCVPATLVFPRQASVLIHADHAGRAEAIRTQQMIMARLLTQIPAGRVRFTIIDPVALGQNFAGFMHLADHDEALVGSRIWTEAEHIEQQLSNLTEHMETVIQKYLRNEFETIDEYNAQAGELAEPYRYLVIADFPIRFEGETFRRLNSIATSGARCGVYTLIVRDTRQPLPGGAHLDELEAHSINLVRKGDRFVWNDEIFKQFPLEVDPPPSEDALTGVLDVVGKKAKEAKRVEVAFSTIAPQPAQIWTGNSASEIQVPIGRLGATRLQMMKLGKGVAQHSLIAGKTGSGKSTLLHVLVTNLALWYGPDQVEFYLVDFKKGVEFKTYATHGLPHARAIAVESDREFGLSVLQRIDAELTRRGELFRKLGVQDLASFRAASTAPMPRTLLMIDEFQEFFSEDDKLSQEAALLLDRLVRQGRAFGIHVLLGSQTIGGSSGLARSTIGQMAVRIALQTSEADSQLILGDANSAARLLSRPGEAIYNDAGGLVEGNSPFQISWLDDSDREVWLDRVREKMKGTTNPFGEPIVFEGNAPADPSRNRALLQLMERGATTRPNAPLVWLGDPVAIKEPTAMAMRAQSGANALIVGQHEESAMALMASAMISLASQYPKGAAKFYLLDGTPADSSLTGILPKTAAAMGKDVQNVDYRNVPEAIAEVAAEVQARLAEEKADRPDIFVFIYGLQRYRMLRKTEESFSFSADEGEKKPQPDKQLSEILREGPSLGVHVIAWIDTSASLDRTFDRGAMREFDYRVLFQMSAADSSALIDSPAGNKLGFNRALVFSEERGTMEKFRPYALPNQEWLAKVAQLLSRHP